MAELRVLLAGAGRAAAWSTGATSRPGQGARLAGVADLTPPRASGCGRARLPRPRRPGRRGHRRRRGRRRHRRVHLRPRRVALAALAGKHVLCEKPLAATLEEATAVADAAAQASGAFMMGFMRRFDAGFVRAERIEAGDTPAGAGALDHLRAGPAAGVGLGHRQVRRARRRGQLPRPGHGSLAVRPSTPPCTRRAGPPSVRTCRPPTPASSTWSSPGVRPGRRGQWGGGRRLPGRLRLRLAGGGVRDRGHGAGRRAGRRHRGPGPGGRRRDRPGAQLARAVRGRLPGRDEHLVVAAGDQAPRTSATDGACGAGGARRQPVHGRGARSASRRPPMPAGAELMRAVRISGPGQVSPAELPAPAPGPDEVLVRVAAAAVCTTDRKLAARGAHPPRVPGHEVAGWLPDGTPVGVHPDVGCGRCDACLAGAGQRCPRRVSIGIDRDGGLAELVTGFPAGHAVPLGGIDLALAPLLEPLACCVRAAGTAGVRAGDRRGRRRRGHGRPGHLVLRACRSHRRRVPASAPGGARPGRRRRRRTGPGPGRPARGEPRVAIVTAPGAEALTWAMERVALGGVVHAFAGTPGGAGIDANLIHYRHLALVGSFRVAGRLPAGARPGRRRPGRPGPAACRPSLAGAPAALLATGPGRPLKTLVDIGHLHRRD